VKNGFKMWKCKTCKKPNLDGVLSSFYGCSGAKRYNCSLKWKVLMDPHSAPSLRYRVYCNQVGHDHPMEAGHVGQPATKRAGWGIPLEFIPFLDDLLSAGMRPGKVYR
jgi:hypothetical protein